MEGSNVAVEQRLSALKLTGLPSDLGQELLARSILTQSKQVGPPVDLDAVHSLWTNLTVSLEDLDGSGYLLDFGLGGGEILIRRRDGRVRRRFTLVHELGHWLLAANCWSPDDQSQAVSTVATAAASSTERWCDVLAVEVLVPRDWLAEMAHSTPLQVLQSATQIADIFQVSRHAALSRISEVWGATVLSVTEHSRGAEIRGYSNMAVSATAVRAVRERGLPNQPDMVQEVSLGDTTVYMVRNRGERSGLALIVHE